MRQIAVIGAFMAGLGAGYDGVPAHTHPRRLRATAHRPRRRGTTAADVAAVEAAEVRRFRRRRRRLELAMRDRLRALGLAVTGDQVLVVDLDGNGAGAVLFLDGTNRWLVESRYGGRLGPFSPHEAVNEVLRGMLDHEVGPRRSP